jgi:hypothetical protein
MVLAADIGLSKRVWRRILVWRWFIVGEMDIRHKQIPLGYRFELAWILDGAEQALVMIDP